MIPHEDNRPLTELFGDALRYEQGRSELTVEAYVRDVREFADYITGGHPEELDAPTVSTSDVRAWLASLSRKGRQHSSIKRKLQSLRAFYHFLMRTKRVKNDPTSPIEMSVRRKELPKYIPGREMERLLAAEDAEAADGSFESVRDRMIVYLLYTTGIRRGEALGLRDSDFRLGRGDVLIHGKGNKDRLLPLPQETVEMIGRYIEVRDREYPKVDLPVDERRFLVGRGGLPMNERTLTEIVERGLAGTSAQQRSPHVLRHTFATAMLNGGADINTVKTFLGHASLATTQIYTHVTFSDMRDAYNSAHPRALKRRKDEK